MNSFKDFFRKYANYVLVAFLIAFSGLIVFKGLIYINRYLEIINMYREPITTDVIELVDIGFCSVIFISSILVLIFMRKLITKKNVVLRYVTLCEALISLDAFIGILLDILDNFYFPNSKIIPAAIMISSFILLLLSAVIVCKNDKTNFTLMIIGNFINFVIFASAASKGVTPILMAILSFFSVITATFYLALYAVKKDEKSIENKE